jgi:hypothetical protein
MCSVMVSEKNMLADCRKCCPDTCTAMNYVSRKKRMLIQPGELILGGLLCNCWRKGTRITARLHRGQAWTGMNTTVLYGGESPALIRTCARLAIDYYSGESMCSCRNDVFYAVLNEELTKTRLCTDPVNLMTGTSDI